MSVMAKSPAPAQKQSFKHGQMTLWSSVAFFALVIWQLPTVMVLFFGMLPAIVAAIIDRTPKKNGAFCVGGINFCGVFPYIMELWTGDNTIDGAMMMLTDVFSLVVMYGAAAFGWMLYQSVPPVIATFVTVLAQSRVASLRSTQRKLIEEWGEDVATPQEVLDMREQFGEEALSAAGEEQAAPETTGSVDTDALLDGIDNLLAGGTPPPLATPAEPPKAQPTAPPAASVTPPATPPKPA